MITWKLKLFYLVSALIICLISFDFANATFNPLINYQGKLTDTSNIAVTDGLYNLKVRLCADSSCSSVLWSEERVDANKVQVTNGLFSILLGNVTSTSLASIDFNQDIYLELQVGGTGVPAWETLLPRKQFGSVPSAFEAGKLGGLASSSYAKLATDEIISGAWAFNNILSVTANSASPALNILQSGAGTGISIGNGTATTTIYGGVTSTFPYGATFATTGGRVGIGTASPVGKLSVYLNNTDYNNVAGANSHVMLDNPSATGQNVLSAVINGTLRGKWRTDYLGNINWVAGGGDHYFYSGTDGSGEAFQMILKNGGKVGIGTTAPDKTLEITSSTGGVLRLTYNDTNGSAANYSDFSVGSDGALTIGTSNSATTTITNGLVVNTNSLVVNKGTGYVGVGTLTPSYMLDVKGSINSQSTPGVAPFNNITNANFVAVNDYNDYPSANFNIGQSTSDQNITMVVAPLYTSAGTNKTAQIVVSTNKSTIESTSYQSYFRQTTALSEFITLNRAGITGAGVGTPIAFSIGYGVGWTEKMRVTSAGIGIGTTGPGKALEINSATGANLRLTYNDSNGSATNYSDLSVGSDGGLTIGTSNTATTTITNALSVSSNINLTGVLTIGGSNYSQYFIGSAGTAGQLWQSDGSASGAWVNTSTLGILPGGTTGQIMMYSPSGWGASSAIYVSSAGYFGINSTTPSHDLSMNGDGYFAQKIEGFEGYIVPPSGYTATGPNTTWLSTTTAVYAGSSSLQTPVTSVDTSSTLATTVFYEVSTTISFWWKVSSENNFDFFGFCIDRTPCLVDKFQTAYDLRISGTGVDWAQVTTTVSPGTHTFQWQYAKDASGSGGSDAGFLDEVYLGTGGKLTLENVLRVGGSILVNTTTAGSDGYKIMVDSGSSSGAGIGVNGYVKASGFITGTTTLDLAETYPFDSSCIIGSTCPEAADLVCADNNIVAGVKKCNANSQQSFIGVVSTNPGFLLGGNDIGEIETTNTAKIALAGRVPIKVHLTTGTIKIGDELTLGIMDGVAQKAIEPGQVIGVALENFGDENLSYPQIGTVLLFINPHWSIGNIEEKNIPTELPDFSTTTTPSILDRFTLAIENSLQKLGLILKNGVAKLKEIIVDKIFVKQLCVGETCIGEQQLKDLLEKNQISQLQTSGQSVLNNINMAEPTVILSDSSSTFSAFTTSTDLVNNDTTLVTTSILNTIVPLNLVDENILPASIPTEVVNIPSTTSLPAELIL
ncbi:MAG: hypothetical protein A2537_03825 [Candidatus Magasanikbacteria bacterium RIFOXYD2_FULL_36_9]|uniref:Peptidase S74 domain-containing protein n=1 Tax=Candidatus Magasanikbacteria bacterium RIFOXYD2_FULL_36_9 TaxID=1798707 RepID=A0A1F6NYJ4_9BACT|nr:MAG: hypothetical protein A2537_03825 [Candidatus Magasanikbacteria bacterium RIFOXYD2_FULL_36_9]